MAKKQVAEEAQAPAKNNLYIAVETFEGKDGKSIGFRIVDHYHYGTRNWLQTHLWWAMHNGKEVEIKTAAPEQVEKYLADGKKQLAERFNGADAAPAEVAA